MLEQGDINLHTISAHRMGNKTIDLLNVQSVVGMGVSVVPHAAQEPSLKVVTAIPRRC